MHGCLVGGFELSTEEILPKIQLAAGGPGLLGRATGLQAQLMFIKFSQLRLNFVGDPRGNFFIKFFCRFFADSQLPLAHNRSGYAVIWCVSGRWQG